MVNSDLAFQGDWAFQGTYDGFVIHNVRNSSQPKIPQLRGLRARRHVGGQPGRSASSGEYDGRLEDEVNDVTFLEGNSNQGHALCYEPVGAPPAYC